MLGQLIKNSSVYAASNLLSRVIGFSSVFFYTQLLSLEQFGIYDYILAVGAIAGVIVPLEVGQSIQRFYSSSGDNKTHRKSLLSTAVIVASCSFAVFTVLAFLANYYWAVVDNGVMAACATMFFLNALIYLMSSVLIAKLDSKGHALMTLSNQIISFGSAVVFILLFDFEALGIVFGQISGSVATLLVFSRKLGDLVALNFSTEIARKILRFSLPIIPSSIGVIGMLYVDRLMLEELQGFREVGIYGVSVRVAAVALIFVIALRSSLTPLIYRANGSAELPMRLSYYLSMYLASGTCLVILCEAVGPGLITSVFGEQFYDSFRPISLLLFSQFVANTYMFYPGLVLAQKTIILSAINIAGLLLNVPLNYFLISAFGLTGAAVATLASSCFTLFLHILVSERYFKLDVNPQYIFLAVFSVGSILCFWKLGSY